MEGYFENDILRNGTKLSINGNRQEGIFNESERMHGHCKEVFTGGYTYEGNYEDNLRNGEFKVFNTEDQKWETWLFENGEMVSKDIS